MYKVFKFLQVVKEEKRSMGITAGNSGYNIVDISGSKIRFLK